MNLTETMLNSKEIFNGKILHASRSFGQVAVSAYNYASEPVLIKNVIGD